MAPTTTMLFSKYINPANGSAVPSMSSPTPYLHVAVLQPTQTTSPKQFIPVGVLILFLILLFFSHLLRYPRILYTSQELLRDHSRSILDNPYSNQQGHRAFHEKKNDSQGSFFPRTYSGSKRLSSFDPHTETIYSEPTVRLVREFHDHIPEPRVYLPEEIILPSPSATLVNSSRSDISISNMDLQSPPPRVYLPPTLPDSFGLCLTHQQADVFYTKNTSSPSNLLLRPSSHEHPPGLFASPQSSPFTGLYDFTARSTDVLAQSSQLDQPQTSAVAASLLVENFEVEPQALRVTRPTELSPLPQAHAHPIFGKRALRSWRRSSPLEFSFDNAFQLDPEFTAVSTRRHGPFVPSRLRHFITRSITTSLSGPQTHSTPASSRKSFDRSLKNTRPNSTPDATVFLRSRRADGSSATCFSEGLLSASARLSELTMIPEIKRHNSSFQTQARGQASHLKNRPLHNYRPLSVPEDVWRESLASSAYVQEEPHELHKRGSSSYIAPEKHGKTSEYRNSVGLGLRLVSEAQSATLQAHGVLEPSADSQDAYIFGSESHSYQGNKFDTRDLNATASLRTIPSRWMSLSPANYSSSSQTPAEEIRQNADTSFDESVEVMVMGRTEGLEGV